MKHLYKYIILFLILFVESSYAVMSIGVNIQNSDKGIFIEDIAKNSSAYKGGLRINDIITYIDLKKIEKNTDITNIIRNYSGTNSLYFTIIRNGKSKYLRIIPENTPFVDYQLKSSIPKQIKLADSYYNKNDYKNAAKYFLLAANAGNAYAQYNTAWMIQHKQGFEWNENNYEYAKDYYLLSAKQGRQDSQYELSEMYYWGKQITQNYEQSILWMKKSAEQGNMHAQFSLGYIYDFGKGYIKEDNKEAAKWYKMAAKQGYSNAQNNLANLLYKGDYRINKDHESAKYWYEKASRQGNINAKNNLDKLYNNNASLEKNEEKGILGKIGDIIWDNKGKIAGAVVAAILADKLSTDDECFLPNNDDCDGYQLKHHKSFYGKLKRHISSYKPSYDACTNEKYLAKYLNQITEYFAYEAGIVATVAFGGDPQILVDLKELRGALDDAGLC